MYITADYKVLAMLKQMYKCKIILFVCVLTQMSCLLMLDFCHSLINVLGRYRALIVMLS